ncbi:MAG TPA: DNA replication/repair protein RecF [Candidatus Gracilibacteria bacterium]|nr:DNA replication/repair protein RecF [Candidatus Gracilibacteria bacterium]
MQLSRLILENFRNHSSLELELNEDAPTYIVGPNALGKTNILEAIYLLALTKSFRTSRQQDMIEWGKDFCRVKGFFSKTGGASKAGSSTGAKSGKTTPLELELFFGVPPQPLKSLKLNGVKTSAVKFIGNCQIVFFHPEDLNMLYLGPDLRRRYLDILNIQVGPRYYAALRSYKRVMEQRNALLKRIKEGLGQAQDLAVWDDQLMEHGEQLIGQRTETIAFLNERISAIYDEMSGKADVISISYEASAPAGEFGEKLKNSLHKDLQAEFTTTGPHRDDLTFSLNGRPIGAHASRGEYRSLLLALKLLELEFYKEKSGEKPLLLLDDVFSELDLNRQKMLLKAIEGHQTIITTTHLDQTPERKHRSLKLESKEIEVFPGDSAVHG